MLREDIVAILLEDPSVDVDLGDVQGDAPIHLACKVRYSLITFTSQIIVLLNTPSF